MSEIGKGKSVMEILALGRVYKGKLMRIIPMCQCKAKNEQEITRTTKVHGKKCFYQLFP
jgi:hypothetical protein